MPGVGTWRRGQGRVKCAAASVPSVAGKFPGGLTVEVMAGTVIGLGGEPGFDVVVRRAPGGRA
jgi:hypothetical protein